MFCDPLVFPRKSGERSFLPPRWFSLVFLSIQILMHPLHGGIQLATQEEARKLLSTSDDFSKHQSMFERRARMVSEKDVTETEYLQWVGTHALAWPEAEQKRLEPLLQKVDAKLQERKLVFPKTVYLILTTGTEEGEAAYTRGAAIIFPKKELVKPAAALERLLYHELFHVYSRHQPEMRQKLYGVIGFQPCEEVTLPDSVAEGRWTNPDAIRFDQAIQVQVGGEKAWVVPTLFVDPKRYDPAKSGSFFPYLQNKFLVVGKGEKPSDPKSVYLQNPQLLFPREFTGFYEQIGRNTGYIIHPEETMADNFALWMMDVKSVPNPEIIEKMKKVLE